MIAGEVAEPPKSLETIPEVVTTFCLTAELVADHAATDRAEASAAFGSASTAPSIALRNIVSFLSLVVT